MHTRYFRKFMGRKSEDRKSEKSENDDADESLTRLSRRHSSARAATSAEG